MDVGDILQMIMAKCMVKVTVKDGGIHVMCLLWEQHAQE